MKTYTVQGHWRGKSAGGCLNFPTWRYNPQLFITVSEQKTVRLKLVQDPGTLFHIGFYVAKSDDTDKRQLLLLRDDIVAKHTFQDSQEISSSCTLEPGQKYVVIPCTFNPGDEGKFTLSFSCEGDLSLNPLPPSKDWKYVSTKGEWKGKSAGGCRNHATCSNNPQYLMKLRKDSTVTILLSQLQQPQKFDVIGFYVVATKDNTSKLRSLKKPDIVCKSEFARPTEACVKVALKGKTKYCIIPCTFDPGHEAKFTLEVFSDNDVKLKSLRDPQEVTVRGEWTGSTAGGCVNHPSWRNNPQYFLIIDQPATVTITLHQFSPKVESIGFYVAKSNGHRMIIVRSSDIVGKGAFEKKREISTVISFEPSENPYIIIPCTFLEGKEGKFSLSVYVHGTKNPRDVLRLLPCNYHWAKKYITYEWRGESAGGCKNHPDTWLKNPQIRLTLDLSCNIVILLTQRKTEKSIGFYVASIKGEPPTKPLTSLSAADIVGKSVFRTDDEVHCKATYPAGVYHIIPCTFEPKQEGIFQVTVFSSSSNFELEPVDFVPLEPMLSGGFQAPSTSGPDAERKLTQRTTSPLGKFSISWSDVTVGKKIGQGGYGAVYRGTWQGKDVAIKKLFREELTDEADVESFRKEIEIMKTYHHPKIVRFLGASLDRPNICILTEFMCKGNLSHVLKSEMDLSWAIKVKMALDAAEGMAYLHSCKPPVVHRDLKSLNLLVDENYNVKVADFGLSKATSGDSLNSKVGSLNWCAPEILLRSSPFTPAGDVYSFGMVLWELTTHTPPFHGMHPLQIVRAIDQNDLPAIPEGTDPEYAQLIKDCWHSDARRRPTFITISQRLSDIEKRMREQKQ